MSGTPESLDLIAELGIKSSLKPRKGEKKSRG
jgi:hypothetical protein